MRAVKLNDSEALIVHRQRRLGGIVDAEKTPTTLNTDFHIQRKGFKFEYDTLYSKIAEYGAVL